MQGLARFAGHCAKTIKVRLAFLLLQCIESALAYGGKVEVTQSDSGWTIRAEAARSPGTASDAY